MSQTFYWYDYETWGINPRTSRPAQFAGIRTDLDFKQIGDPLVVYSKPTDDMLPDPEAVMITGITPQIAKEQGIKEADFAKKIHEELSKPNTVSLGFNTIRFDEAFNRFLFWRNFYDPYEHSWKDGTSAWDIIDVVRLTRALRPDGINWPEENGKPTNRLEKLSVANNIEHSDAHDALADVRATIEIAKLIKQNQPKLFEYCFQNRDKASVAKILDPNKQVPVVHASDKFGSKCLSTALVVPIATIENGRKVLVFDLKTNPEQLMDLSVEEISANLFTPRKDLGEDVDRIGVKGVKINASPVLAPAGTIDDAAAERILLDRKLAAKHLSFIKKNHSAISSKLGNVFTNESDIYKTPGNGRMFIDAESQLYDGFVNDHDRSKLPQVVSGNFDVKFQDERLSDLLVHYKARNFPESLSQEEQDEWNKYRTEKLTKSDLNFETFGQRLAKLAEAYSANESKLHLLEQLQLYAESIYPYDT